MTIFTKANHAKLAKLEALKDKASQAVYDVVAPRNDIPFNQCYERACDAIRMNYHVAVKNLEEFRYEMVSQGRAWFSSGMFVTNFR